MPFQRSVGVAHKSHAAGGAGGSHRTPGGALIAVAGRSVAAQARAR